MALKTIDLSNLVDTLDAQESDFADFFRPMLGYDAVLTLYEGINDDYHPLILEIEDETGFEFPGDVIAFYMCTNGGVFGELELYPISSDSSLEYDIHRNNVTNKELKISLGLNPNVLLLGKYIDSDTYVIGFLNDDKVYTYALWDSKKKAITMEFEYLIQLVALEISYNIDNEGFMDLVKESKK